MGKVVGLGGIFFRSENPAALRAWYAEHLSMPVQDFGAVLHPKNVPKGGYHLWSPFDKDTQYFGPGQQPMMINLMVDDLEACLAQVRKAGAEGVRGPEDSEYGRFGWFLDPDGRQVELWQPSPELPKDAQ